MKKVNFKKLSIINFLSVGEEPVTVEFNKGLHVITGKNKDKPDRRNAIGKSTIADALYFAIFGETLRELKKDLIPNNLTNSKTHVELDFELDSPRGKNNYKIIRTLSPSKVFKPVKVLSLFVLTKLFFAPITTDIFNIYECIFNRIHNSNYNYKYTSFFIF